MKTGMEKKILNLNEAFVIRFVCNVSEHQNMAATLVRVIERNKFNYGDVTKETDPLTYATGRQEVWFTVLVKDVTEAAFIRSVIQRVN